MNYNNIFKYCVIIFIICIAVSCNKNKEYAGEWDPNKIKGYNNESYYSSRKMDSLQSIFHITRQKLQEVYDLAILASENRQNKDIDTLLLSQIQGYFPKGDTIYTNKIVRGVDSIKAKYVRVDLEQPNTIDSINFIDSIGVVNFKIQFYNEKKRLVSIQQKKAEYILKKNPEKFKLEFKFYFSSIGNPEK